MSKDNKKKLDERAPSNYVRRAADESMAAIAVSSTALVPVPVDQMRALDGMFSELVGYVSQSVHESATAALATVDGNSLSTYDNRPGFKIVMEVTSVKMSTSPTEKGGTMVRQAVSGRVLRIANHTSDCVNQVVDPSGLTVSCTYNSYLPKDKDKTAYQLRLSVGQDYQTVVVKTFLTGTQAVPPVATTGSFLCLPKVRTESYVGKRDLPLAALIYLVSQGYALTVADGGRVIDQELVSNVMSASGDQLAADRDTALANALRMHNALNPDDQCDSVTRFIGDFKPAQPFGPDGPYIYKDATAVKIEGGTSRSLQPTDLVYKPLCANGGFASVGNVRCIVSDFTMEQPYGESAVKASLMPPTRGLSNMYRDGFVAAYGNASTLYNTKESAHATDMSGRRFVDLSDPTSPTVDKAVNLGPDGKPASIKFTWNMALSSHKRSYKTTDMSSKITTENPMFGLCFAQIQMTVAPPGQGADRNRVAIFLCAAETVPDTPLQLPVSPATWCSTRIGYDYLACLQGSFVHRLNPLSDVANTKEQLDAAGKDMIRSIHAKQPGVPIDVNYAIGTLSPVYFDAAATVLAMCGTYALEEDDLVRLPLSVLPASSIELDYPADSTGYDVVHRKSRQTLDKSMPIVVLFYYPDETVAYDPRFPPTLKAYRGRDALEKIKALVAANRALSPQSLFVFNVRATPVVLFRLGLGPNPSAEEETAADAAASSAAAKMTSNDQVKTLVEGVLCLSGSADSVFGAKRGPVLALEPVPLTEQDADTVVVLGAKRGREEDAGDDAGAAEEPKRKTKRTKTAASTDAPVASVIEITEMQP